MALSDRALCSLQALKAYLGLEVADYDSALEGIIEAVSAGAESHTGRALMARDYSPDPADPAYDPDNAVFDGYGGETLALPQYPVQSLTGLSLNGLALAPASGVSPGWVLNRRSGMVSLVGGVFTPGLGNVAVAYRAGYETAPADLAQAAVEWAAAKVLDSHLAGNLGGKRLGLRSEALPDGLGTRSFESGALPAAVRAVLDRYRKAVFA